MRTRRRILSETLRLAPIPGLFEEGGHAMLVRSVTDWDDAYTNGAHIAGGDRWPAAWTEAAAAFRKQAAGRYESRMDVAYGAGERHRYDLFLPAGTPKGLFVYMHGGYWKAFDKSAWSHVARGPLEHGWAVALPSYDLCPDVRIAEIGRQVAAAVEAAAVRIDGPIRLAGHSAGGHLVTRLVSATSPLDPAVRGRIANTVSISGVHDLRPLMRTQMNDVLRLDDAEAAAESPALLRPADGVRLVCWVGAAERSEFIRQSGLLANVWLGLGAATALVVEPDRHHFNIIDGLSDPSHPLTHTLLDG
jgi:acetyl esterase/lipase